MGLLSKGEKVVAAAVDAVTEMTDRQRVNLHGRLSLAGKIQPHIVKLYVDTSEMREIGRELLSAIDLVDVFLLILFGMFTIPMGRVVYNYFEKCPTLRDESKHSRILKQEPSSMKVVAKVDDYYDSVTYAIARMLQQVARLAALVYWFDCALITFQVLGFEINGDPSGKFASILYSTWAFFTLKEFKRYLLGVAINRKPNKLGKAVVCDRIIDVLIYSSWGLNIMDTINFEFGPGLASLFAFGGLGTFVFGMASRDMAAQVVSGITLTTSEKFMVGEFVKMGDGTQGVVHSMGWLYTDLRCADEIIIKIPNNQLANQRISNISRIVKSQVKASLRVSYGDYKKIPQFCETLKNRLIDDCPQLICDGSRPFRVNWRGFQTDHLLVVVDTHHDTKPIGDEFYDNQQSVFEVIIAVAEECKITFTAPLYQLNINSGENDIDSQFEVKTTGSHSMQ